MRLRRRKPHVSILRLQPGDILVARCTDRTLTAETAARMKAELERIAEGHKVVVLGPGMSFEIARGQQPVTKIPKVSAGPAPGARGQEIVASAQLPPRPTTPPTAPAVGHT